MHKLIPVYYSEYGRYINRFRQMPSNIDALRPVERRLLLALHEQARTKLTKSAKVIGYCLGKYHPHGDSACYNTLVKLVEQGYAIGQGNWGSPGIEDSSAAHYRYTETKLEKWVEALAFEYIDHVPYEELELEPEPLYLPSPIPIGLIGTGVITGISFYRSLIPKFKINSLAKRLLFLLNKVQTPEIILPNIENCKIQEASAGQLESILTKGTGTLIIIPDGSLDKNYIKILGKVPSTTFKSLQNDAEKIDINIIDNSGKSLEVLVEAKKRSTDLKVLGTKIWSEYLTKNINFSCIFCDDIGKVREYGIDEILLNNYHHWKLAVKSKEIADYNKISNKRIELLVVQIIRYIFEQFKCTRVQDIVQKYNEFKKSQEVSAEIETYDMVANKWVKETKSIKDTDIIEVCNKRSIKNLIETDIDIKQTESDLNVAKSKVMNVEKGCIDFIEQLSKI
jgi:hypothetical protein